MVTVMIVDSEEKRGSRISSILRANGYKSTPVTSITMAARQICEQWPDVILVACTNSDSTSELDGNFKVIYANPDVPNLSRIDALLLLLFGNPMSQRYSLTIPYSSN